MTRRSFLSVSVLALGLSPAASSLRTARFPGVLAVRLRGAFNAHATWGPWGASVSLRLDPPGSDEMTVSFSRLPGPAAFLLVSP